MAARRIQRRHVTVLAAALAACTPRGETLDGVVDQVRARFPNVPHISTHDLSAWLDDPARAAPVLLDVRTTDEYAVSHLRGAVHAEDSAAARRSLPSLDTPVVLYCSVGLRSAGVAAELVAAGYTRVQQLEGSIFRWATEGRPLYRGDLRLPRPVVHPYNRTWGRLLPEALWQWRAAP